MPRPQSPTIKAVLVEAQRLRDRAEAIRRNDVWAKPYSPSDATARKLSQNLGPDAAIETMRRHAADVDNEYREDQQRSERAAKRHDRHLQIVEATRRHNLAGLSVGQRLDRALRGLGAATTVPAQRLDTDRVTGSREKSQPPKADQSDSSRFRERALLLVMQAEDALDRATPADLWPSGDEAA